MNFTFLKLIKSRFSIYGTHILSRTISQLSRSTIIIFASRVGMRLSLSVLTSLCKLKVTSTKFGICTLRVVWNIFRCLESFRCGSPVWCTADVWAYRIVTATTAFSFARYWACLSVVWLRDQFWLCIICFVWSITCPFFIVTQMSRNINSSVLWILVCNYLCCIFIVAADFMLWFSCNSLSIVCMNAANNVDFLYVCC